MAASGSTIGEVDEIPGPVKETFCQPCLNKDQQTVADTFCSNCNEFQCYDCSNEHNVYAILKNHTFMSVKEANATNTLLEIKTLCLCNQHQKLFEFFCEDEKKLCCRTCAIAYHKKCHSVVEIEKIVGNMTSSDSGLGQKLAEAREDAEGIARHICSSKDQVAQDIKEMQVKIRQMREEVMRMFDDLEDFVVRRAETFQRETLENMTMKQTQIEKHLADVTSYLETIKSFFKKGTPLQKYIAEQKMESKVNAFCRNIKDKCQNLEKVNISFHFDETLKLPPLPVTENVPGKLLLKSYRQEDVYSINMTMKLTPVSAIILKKTGDDIDEPLYSGIDFLPDGRLVAVDNTNKKCLVYNEKLEKVGTYQLSYNPLSVAVVSEEELAISSGSRYKIKFLHVSECNEISSSRTCKVKTKYYSICLKDDGQFVVGTYDDPRPVRIVSLDGKEQDFSVNFRNKTYPIGTSASIYIKSSDKVVITDTDDDAVYIYDMKTNTRVVVKDDQIQQPRGVAVGPSDTILVCSCETNSIVQISPSGQILSSYKMNMKYPYKVCVSRDKSFLIVTNNCAGNKEMQKFKISI
ncbi:E3 ubiquitin-protein ligase TRIM71-like [Ruditapes philippinarum]|uniref:E3 ubiquitin-protein ligase TRIM71-like n=1 Tax=Ruditapes philippinarum TaxID=129788 RepID=UPI00295C20BB|nr:E3 ubiquitin-protein ligase TRIM71-like [Ruditapes philippinarum]